jgi:hypothetical protein
LCALCIENAKPHYCDNEDIAIYSIMSVIKTFQIKDFFFTIHLFNDDHAYTMQSTFFMFIVGLEY